VSKVCVGPEMGRVEVTELGCMEWTACLGNGPGLDWATLKWLTRCGV